MSLAMLRQSNTTLGFDARGRGLVEITGPVVDWTTGTGMESGLLTLFVRHTSASLVVQENVDPDVRGDLERVAVSCPESPDQPNAMDPAFKL